MVGEPAAADCEVVRRLRAAGAIVVGKTNMPELALWPQLTESQTWGATRNPWDPQRSTGGSSGGSAAAVAAGMVAGALGSDGGGSIRIPSAACGLFGIKPQRGRVPLAPDDDHWLGLTLLRPDDAHGGRRRAAARRPRRRPAADYAAGRRATAPAAAADRRLDQADAARQAEGGRPRGASRRPPTCCARSATWCASATPTTASVQPLFGPRYARGAWLDAQRLGRRSELERRTRGIVRVGARMERMAARARAKEAARAARINAIFDEHDVLDDAGDRGPAAARRAASTAPARVRAFLGAGEFACYTAVWNVTGQPAAARARRLRRRRACRWPSSSSRARDDEATLFWPSPPSSSRRDPGPTPPGAHPLRPGSPSRGEGLPCRTLTRSW